MSYGVLDAADEIYVSVVVIAMRSRTARDPWLMQRQLLDRRSGKKSDVRIAEAEESEEKKLIRARNETDKWNARGGIWFPTRFLERLSG